MERRKFIRYIGTVGTAFVVLPNLVSCSPEKKRIKTKILGQNKNRGHAIRDNKLAQKVATRSIQIESLIIGGGVSGLSCAYQLKKNNYTDFLVLELNDFAGGNSASGEHKHSEFPLGAHYLTLPNPENRPLIEFLKELKLITKEINGQQEYAEEFLCHAPDERLLYRGVFQEGLVPNYGISAKASAEIKRFFELMHDYKEKKGSDNLFLFDIPFSKASNDNQLFELDKICFKEFLDQEKFVSEELLWFLDYCCRDDFGAGSNLVSAWAGINYFAGRKSNPSNTIPSNVLTWPEGNSFLINQLEKSCIEQIKTNIAVTGIEEFEDKVKVLAFDFTNNELLEFTCKNAIIACPSYVTKHILKSPFWEKTDFEKYMHHPWLVSTVVLDKIPESNGLSLAWDNVKFGTKGLGYINNQNQNFGQQKSKHVISVYLAFDKQGDVAERQKMFSLSEEEMKAMVLEELKGLHENIEENVEEIYFQQWGHGMVTPYPNSLEQHKKFRIKNSKSNRIRLAHTDYSSYSIFEEGFSQGLESANFILQHV
jgi:protoporphyrinogen oxidase